MKAETYGHEWLGMDLPFPCEIHVYWPQPSVLPGAKKILAIFTEPRIAMAPCDWVRANYQLYDLILTYDRSLSLLPNVRLIEFGSAWVNMPPAEKEFSVSFLLSTGASLSVKLAGYDIRRGVAQTVKKFAAPVRLFFSSRGIHILPEELQRIKDNATEQQHSIAVLESSKGSAGKEPMFKSMFHICIENANDDYFFTEKVMDCFRTHTIPIYWGTNKISEFFDPKGMIFVDSAEDVNNVLSKLTEDDYWQHMPSIKENYQRAEKYLDPTQRAKDIILDELGQDLAAYSISA